MGTTPPTHACAVCFINFCAETKFKKGESDRNLPPIPRLVSLGQAAARCVCELMATNNALQSTCLLCQVKRAM